MSLGDEDDLYKALAVSDEIVRNEEIIKELEQRMNQMVLGDMRESFKGIVEEVRPAPLSMLFEKFRTKFEFTDRDFFWLMIGMTSGIISCNFATC